MEHKENTPEELTALAAPTEETTAPSAPQEPLAPDALLDDAALRAQKRCRIFATLALVFGILSVPTLSGVLLFSVLALVFVRKSRDKETRKLLRRAKAGKILGIIGIVLGVLAVLFTVIYVGVVIFVFVVAAKAIGEGIGNALTEAFSNALS